MKQRFSSDIGWSTADKITIRGKSLPDDILGKINLGDFAFFQMTGVLPTKEQGEVFNAILVALVEHGLTPSALVARLTYAGAPESLQAAVAAGLCGLGTVFVGTMEGAARYLSEAVPLGTKPQADLDELATAIVDKFFAAKQAIPGLGHPIHKPVDPRTKPLLAIAERNGFGGVYIDLVQSVQREAERKSGKNLPLNATGAIGAIACELGFEWGVIRGFGVLARSIGLVGHIMEERRNPLALKVWTAAEDEASSHFKEA